MQFWRLVVVTGTFLLPSSLLAQHAVAPAPPVSHISSTPSAGIHSSSVPTSRTPGATSVAGGQGSHTAAQPAHDPKATSVKFEEVSHAASTSSSERRGLFSFLRKRGPIPSNSGNNCKNGQCSAKNSTPAANLVAPAHTEARLGCYVVPVNNPAIPCNSLTPCCP